MAGSTISITFKLDGDGKGFKELTKDAEGLKTALSSAIKEGQNLNSRAINFAAITTGITQTQDALTRLQDTMKSLSASYAASEQANVQLTTVMRQRMGATDSDIKSIKQVIAAQKELGVIGGTVQVRGAQQIATFLNEKSSLEVLIPAMNNLLAQQKGLNATQEDAYGVANLMGKAMQGQTSALRRVGITFNETQEQVMKYGNETQRANMLAQIITDNVGNMNAELGKTDIGKQKQLENSFASIKVKIGAIAQQGLPFVTFAAQSLILVGSITKLATSVRTCTAVVMAWDIRGKAAAVTAMLLGVRTSQLTVVMRVFTGAMTTGAYTATALKIALRGLMIATAVGAAIVAVTMIVEHLASANDKAAQSADGLSAAEQRQKEATDRAKSAHNAEMATVNQATAALELQIERLKNFKGSKEDEKKIVNELNSTYGETMGYFSSVADWYQALIKNSKAYCDQMVLEAETRMYANQIAEKESQIRDARNGKFPDGALQDYANSKGVDAVVGAGGGTGDYWIAEQERQVQELRRQMQEVVKKSAALKMPVKGSLTPPSGKSTPTPKITTGSGGGNTTTTQKTRYQELGDLIEGAKNKYIKASVQERAELANKIQDWKKEREQIELLQRQAELPIDLKSLQDVDDAISYQEELRKQANDEARADIDKEIAKLEALKATKERAGHVDKNVEEIKTYKELNDELSYYTDLLNDATEGERPKIQAHINQLNDLKKAWDDTREALNKPADISQLNSIEKLDEAIRYYQDQQNKQSGDEIENIQRVIQALEAKRKAMQRGAEIPSMQNEIDEINGLSGKELKLKVRGIGFDALTDKIKDLQKILDDTQNPVSGNQRKEIEGMIATYEQWRKKSIDTFETVRDGWGGLKGFGDSISNITSALEDNSNAWQKVTAIIDGFIQIYESISAIVGIIQMLTVASQAHAVAKTGEAAATAASTTATGVDTASQEAAAVAMIPVIVANKAATASYMELASAEYFAAHAYIPFAGYGIGAGFVAAATAMVEAVGVMPFAKGGVISGPTLALVGEYAGASNNPEVVAPLDKLRQLIPQQAGYGGRVSFEIRGRKLVGVLSNETRIANISGRRTDIK